MRINIKRPIYLTLVISSQISHKRTAPPAATATSATNAAPVHDLTESAAPVENGPEGEAEAEAPGVPGALLGALGVCAPLENVPFPPLPPLPPEGTGIVPLGTPVVPGDPPVPVIVAVVEGLVAVVVPFPLISVEVEAWKAEQVAREGA